MHFSTILAAVILILFVLCRGIYRTLFDERRHRRFEREFEEAYRFTPHAGKYDKLEELQVTEKLEEAARELIEVRSNLRHYRDTRDVDSLESATFRGMLVDETAAAVNKLERQYKRLRKLAHWAGYSWQLLDELHEQY